MRDSEKTIALILSLGLRVFMRNRTDSYCHYTNAEGTQIAYCQFGAPYSDTRVSTVHKPNRTSGTGFIYADEITEDTLRGALACFAPGWASSYDRASVRKWKNWTEFKNADSWNKGYTEVAK